ncbi:MAG: DNA polymerase III subunit beta [Candidatus Caldarchaeum sp.]
MQITCDREALLYAVNAAYTVVPRRPVMPALAHLRFVARGEALAIEATNIETSVSIACRASQVHKEGVCLVPASMLTKTLALMTNESVHLDANGSTVRLFDSQVEYELATYDPDALPEFKRPGDEFDFQTQTDVLRQLIDRVRFATVDKETYVALSCVLLENADGKLRLVATDGHRLALAEGIAIWSDAARKLKVLVSARSLTILSHILRGELPDSVFVRIEEKEAVFRTSRFALRVHLFDGEFPPYRDVAMRITPVARMKFTAGQLLAALKGVIVSSDNNAVDLRVSDNKLVLANASETRRTQAKVEVPIEEHSGEVIELRLNARFVTEMLATLNRDEHAVMEYQGETKAAVFRVNDDYLYLVMPIVIR